MNRLSIIIPAYNEEKRIGKTLIAYSQYFDKLVSKDEIDYEIIVVINNTTDKTEDIVKKYLKKNKRILYLNIKKGGKGYATLEGFKHALKRNNDLIGFVDADMATPPEAFFYLAQRMNNYDAVIASRYIKGSIVKPKPTLQRIIVSRIYNSLIRCLFLIPYRDTQCGAKLFKREAIADIISNLGMTKWAFDFDLIYNLRKKYYRIKEIPTKWSDKEYSKINFMKSGPWMALAIVRLRLLNSPFKRFIRVYDWATSLLR